MTTLRLFVRDPGGEKIYDLDREEVVIGRGTEATVRLDDRKLSRSHCRLYRGSDGWRVADMSSLNGTLLNGTPVVDDHLGVGDRIDIGESRIAVSFPSLEKRP